MSVKAYKKIQTDDRIQNTIQKNAEAVFNQIIQNPILQPVILKGVELKALTQNVVNHKLDREYIGYLVIGQNKNAIVWSCKGPENNDDPHKYVVLNSDLDVTVDLMIF